jgi:hypothetical protein
MSRLLMAIQTAGTPAESPSHRGPTPKTSSGCQLHHSDTRSAHRAYRAHPTPPSPSIQEEIQFMGSHPLPQPTVLLNSAPPKAPVPLLSRIAPTEDRSLETPPVNPKTYTPPSDDGFSDGDIDHLINLFQDLSADMPSHPPQGIHVTCLFCFPT